jgi:2-hydroxy-3-oxopropionate reductase
MQKLGFIGLGIMGKEMANNLIQAGHEVYLYTRSEIPILLIEDGGIACIDAKEVAKQADIIFIMVPNTSHVEDVLFSENGVAKGLSAGKVVVDMSSISPIDTKRFAKAINDLGCTYLDAPVSGGDVGAKNGTLSIMVGGDEQTFDRVKPYFEVMGQNITLVGANGDGQTAKAANQIIVALNIEAVSEALVFASKAGANPAKVREALMGGFASSKILDVHGARMIERNFEPGFRVELHQKDIDLALQSAKELGVSLPNTATVQQLYNSSNALGDAKKDHSSIVKVIEKLSDHNIS